jgi:hypothetical protein
MPNDRPRTALILPINEEVAARHRAMLQQLGIPTAHLNDRDAVRYSALLMVWELALSGDMIHMPPFDGLLRERPSRRALLEALDEDDGDRVLELLRECEEDGGLTEIDSIAFETSN